MQDRHGIYRENHPTDRNMSIEKKKIIDEIDKRIEKANTEEIHFTDVDGNMEFSNGQKRALHHIKQWIEKN